MEMMTFTVPARPPFRLDLTVWALRRRPDNAIDRWDGRTYRRVLVLEGRPLEIEVVQVGEPDRAELQVTATGTGLGLDTEPCLRPLLSSLLGRPGDQEAFYRLAATDAGLSALADRLRGLKPPRFPTLFEALVNAIACQQITLTLGIRLLNRLAERYGPVVPKGDGQAHDGLAHGFPRPCDLGAADPDDLRSLGFSRQKARAMLELAQAVATGRRDLDTIAAVDDATAVKRLCELRGVGRWTAEYVLLRGLGRLNVFPGDDVGARNNLGRWLGLPDALDYGGVHRAVAPWQSYAGLVYLHLLIDKLAASGQVVP
jgi:DNA-3-methyladenine glycosylase II